MGCVQIKGTRKEVMEMLQLFDQMDTQGASKFKNHVEVQKADETTNDEFVASFDLQAYEYDAQDTFNDQLVSQMLTGVYND
ncbi:hypothetical protein BAMA_13455 [Bacillus manliponensis]|uniref:DUF3911 domain-containing protein n=1 Tax=Bacillus manliponensis TaxID=574376 RepID=A0A073JZH6_9BACI|nr:DUF3911 family protein [Bacillus manliponensis]KEK20424.1 hypothetical protein BAMA_13455 [Bacillus manliponensis]